MTEREKERAVTAMEAILALSEQVVSIARTNIEKAKAAQDVLRQFTEPPERTQG